jgi:transcriptional regulator with PAS, ATPase and Fis domain
MDPTPNTLVLQQDTSHQKQKSLSDEPETIPGKSLNMAEVTNHIIQQALLKAGGNKTQAAKLLGITRSKLLYRMRQ